MRKHISNHSNYNQYSKSFSNLHHPQIKSIDLKEFYLRKSIFDPPQGLAEFYAFRSHIPGAEVPLIEVVHSGKRWLLLQSPKLTHNVFLKVVSGTFGNPYSLILHLFKSMVVLSQMYGYFLITSHMTFIQNKQVRVWINEDIFSNQIQVPLKQGSSGQKQFVLGFFLMLQKEMKEWERVTDVFTIEETIHLLDWRSKINRTSLTSVQASKAVFPRPFDSNTSFEPHQLKYYSEVRGCRSVQDIKIPSHLEYINAEMSSSYTVKEEEEKLMFKKKIDKHLLYDSKDMKISIDQECGHPQPEFRKTKKKFNLTSTSSTLQQFSEKLASTIGKKGLRLKGQHLGERPKDKVCQRSKDKTMHKSEPISIANELDGLFEEDEKHEFKLGVEGDKEQLQKIAEQIEQVLIW